MTASFPSAAPCIQCNRVLPVGARFCPRCGEPVSTADAVPPLEATTEYPPSVHHVERRPLGVSPVPFLGALAIASLAGAIALIASGDWIVGIVLLLLAGLLAALFASGARQDRESATSRFIRTTSARFGGSIGFAVAACRTWSVATAEVVRIRLRRLRLRRELHSRLAPLGEAVHRDDETSVRLLKERTAELEQALERARRRESAVLGAARHNIQRARVPVQPTEVIAAAGEPQGTSARDPRVTERVAAGLRPDAQAVRAEAHGDSSP